MLGIGAGATVGDAIVVAFSCWMTFASDLRCKLSQDFGRNGVVGGRCCGKSRIDSLVDGCPSARVATGV